MKWIKIDPNNLPENEVLAGNFEEGTSMYKQKMLGRIYFDVAIRLHFCIGNEEYLWNATHYVDINKFDIPPKEAFPSSKVCGKCNIEKELDLFKRNKDGRYGRYSICKECNEAYDKKYREENKEKFKAYRKMYAIKKRRK